jgi:hypothetical protein
LFSDFEVVDGRTSIKAPATWPEKDQAKWNAIIQACNEVAIKAFKKPMRDLDRAVYKLPFHRGEEKEYEGTRRSLFHHVGEEPPAEHHRSR